MDEAIAETATVTATSTQTAQEWVVPALVAVLLSEPFRIYPPEPDSGYDADAHATHVAHHPPSFAVQHHPLPHSDVVTLLLAALVVASWERRRASG
jgi:hypothetical protein